MGGYPENLDRWREAARIAARARELGARTAQAGVLRRDIAEQIEQYIRSEGAEPAFPVNLSRNYEAAHYTPSASDDLALEPGDLLKVDVGAHLDGAIADTATTVEIGGTRRFENLIRATREAVEAGIAQVRPGVAVDVVSRAIEAAIQRRGVKPVSNLTGHTIERFLLHAGKSIPNVAGSSQATLEEGEIVAIEPFATNGEGQIENGPFGNIVRFRSDPGEPDSLVGRLYARYRTLPFATRWLSSDGDRKALLAERRKLQVYPVFVEAGRGQVAQAEHTILVRPDRAEVLTRID